MCYTVLQAASGRLVHWSVVNPKRWAIVVLVVAVALAASLELDLGARPNNQRREVGKSLLGYVGGGFLQSILDAHLQSKMT